MSARPRGPRIHPLCDEGNRVVDGDASEAQRSGCKRVSTANVVAHVQNCKACADFTKTGQVR